MASSWRFGSWLAAAAATVCVSGSSGCQSGRDPTHQPSRPVGAAPGPKAQAPRLVVSIVVDQLPSWALERHRALLPADGLLARLAREGAFHTRARFGYAGTYTASGHATIYTGGTPTESGVFANERWDPERNRAVATVDDGKHAVHGPGGAFASPKLLRLPTVADDLRAASAERGKVVSLSYKDRGSVIPGGQRPTAALWFNTALPGFTTSSYYAAKRPDWLERWHEENPLEARLTPWTPLDPSLYARELGPDDSPGEGKWLGLDNHFPHDPRRSSAPHSAFRMMPAATDYLLELAWAAIDEYELGRDEHVDLLTLSVSGVDYAGHVFGPESWEYVDHLVRMDAALGRFVRDIERRFPVSVLLTSDHGAAPLPERTAASGKPSGRLNPDLVLSQLRAATLAEFGDDSFVQAFIQPFVYITGTGNERDRRMQFATRWLTSLPEVHAAYDVRERAALAGSQNAVERAVAASLGDPSPGALFVVPARGFVFDEDLTRGAGTSHGSPWEYDTEVPVAFMGVGVRPVVSGSVVPASAIAPTLRALLRLKARAATSPLEGAPRAAF